MRRFGPEVPSCNDSVLWIKSRLLPRSHLLTLTRPLQLLIKGTESSIPQVAHVATYKLLRADNLLSDYSYYRVSYRDGDGRFSWIHRSVQRLLLCRGLCSYGSVASV